MRFSRSPTHCLRRFERSDYGYKGVSLCILRVVAHKLLSQRACCLKKLFGCQGTPCRRGQTVTGSGTGRAVWFGSPSFYNGHFLSKKQVCICKHFANRLPSPAVRRCNSFCFYGIAAAIGLRHTNGNIGVTISNIRPECFSFSLPLLQFQKRFLASSANKAFEIIRPAHRLPLLRSGVGDLAKPDTKNWTSNLLIFIQS